MSATTTTKNPLDLFVQGAKQGWNIAVNSMLPNVLMAYVIIHILRITKVLDIIGTVAAPIMGLWGLPGEALVVLLAAFMSMGGAVGVAASLLTGENPALTPLDVTVMAPAIMLMGSLIQYIGRCLGTADANPKYWGWHIVICIVNGLIAMWLMRLFLLFF
ncbi:MAG: Inner membrane protein YjiG [Desulfovibrio sp.]